MPREPHHLQGSTEALPESAPESMVVVLARNGDRAAFGELVRRRQSWIRNLMRRFCSDHALADDLAQEAFLQAWKKLSHLRQADRFGPWLKRVAVTVWLQHLRKNDALKDADDQFEAMPAPQTIAGLTMDLDRALATLSNPVRLCVVLSYHEGMTHTEISELSGLPPGTVKSHIRRGSERLREFLVAYEDDTLAEKVQ